MLDPTQLAIRRRELAVEYRDKMVELADIKKKKALEMIRLMETHKTKAKAEVYWQASDLGQKEIEIKYYTDGLLEIIRSVKTEVDMLSAEAHGQY